jgi:hypothetical protein
MFLRDPQKETEDKIGYFGGLLIGHLAAGGSDGIDRSMLASRLGVGPWLNEAKRAMRRGAPDHSEIVVSRDLSIPRGVLKQHATARGQKIAYVVDAAYHEENVDRIIALARWRPDFY